MSDEENGTRRPLPCLTCRGETVRLDSEVETGSRGIGWAFMKRRVVSECPTCKTGPRLRLRMTIELDEGPFPKRSLRS